MSISSAADRLCVGEQLESLPKVAAALGCRRDRLSVGLHPLPPARGAGREAKALRRGRDARLCPPVLGLRAAQALQLRPPCRRSRWLSSTRRRRTSPGAGCTSARCPTACTRSTACSTRSAERPSGRLWSRWPSGWGRRTSEATSSAGLMRPVSWPTTRWTRARCLRRHSVRPHINLTTTLEGLKNELGAPPAEPRALAAHLESDPGAHRLRLHDVARPARRLDGDRRRAGDANCLGTDHAGAAGQRQGLPVPRL